MDKAVKIFVNMAVPESIGYDGKTGSLVRLVEMFKHLQQLDSGISYVFNVTEHMAQYFQKNGIEARYNILPTKLKFSGYVGLGLKTFFLVIKSFFVFDVPRTNTSEEKIVVYASSDLFWEVIPAWAYKISNKRIEWVQIIHHIYPDWKRRSGKKIINFFGYYLQRLSLFLIRKKADKIILMNSLVSDKLLQMGCEARKMHVLSNGIDFDHFNALQEIGKSFEGIFLGRLNPSKGFADLIPIWKKVCEKMPAAKLAIIGGAGKKSKADLIREIKEQGLEKNIQVLGFLPDADAGAMLKASKVFVFPSHEEGWGMAIAEAMACGVPVVSWDLPVYQEIFADYTFQIKENDNIDFADRILKLLSDNIYREEVGAKGQKFIKKYSWTEVARQELEIIRA